MKPKDWDKISENYYEEILSPLKNSERNPLIHDLKKIADKKKTVIDLGCGLGELVPFLAKRFRSVVGIDYSQKMIEKARTKNKLIPNASFFSADMLKMKRFHDSFDVAVAVNSLLSSRIRNIAKTLAEFSKVLKPKGKLFLIVPSMEVYLYQAQLIMDTHLEKGFSQLKARQKARRLITNAEHDFIQGTVTFEGDTQKCFYRFEIRHRLKKAGFKNIKIEKVLYSWKEFSKAGQAYIPEADPPWDWYVVCGKP